MVTNVPVIMMGFAAMSVVFVPMIGRTDLLPLLALLKFRSEATWLQLFCILGVDFIRPVVVSLRLTHGLSGLHFVRPLTYVIQFVALLLLTGAPITTAIAVCCLLEQYGFPWWTQRCARAKQASRGGEKRQLRVALIGDSFRPTVDGVTTFTTELLKHHAKEGNEVAIMTHTPIQKEDLHGATLIQTPGLYMAAEDHYLTILTFSTFITLLRFRPDVVVGVEGALPCNLFSMGCLRFCGIPTVVTLHSRMDLWHNEIAYFPWPVCGAALYLMGRLYDRCEAIMCVSQDLCRLVRTHAEIGSPRNRYWSSGVDLSGFTPSMRSEAMRQRLTGGAPAEVPLVIHAGRLTIDKGSHKLPKIFEAISKRLGGRVRFAIFGSGERRAAVEAECREKGLSVFCEGALHGSELHTAMASGDVFISPCLTEAIGLCLMEALASGVPVVAPRVGGIPEFVIPGDNGFLFEGVPVFETEICADLVCEALELRAQGLSERAAGSMRDYGWQRSMAEMDDVLHKC